MRFAIPLIVLALAACDTTTGLDGVTMEGKWDAVGVLGQAVSGLKLRLQPETNGAFNGTWQTATISGTLQGQRAGTEGVTFTLFGYPGGNRQFSGSLTTILRMVGTLDLGQTNGEAIFLRSSFSP
jgi:hypothetical protein